MIIQKILLLLGTSYAAKVNGGDAHLTCEQMASSDDGGNTADSPSISTFTPFARPRTIPAGECGTMAGLGKQDRATAYFVAATHGTRKHHNGWNLCRGYIVYSIGRSDEKTVPCTIHRN